MRDVASVPVGEQVWVRASEGDQHPRLPATRFLCHNEHGVTLTVEPSWELNIPFTSWMHVEDADGLVLRIVDPEEDAATGIRPDLE